VGRLLGLEPFKINLAVIAAFLTLVGYSVNDTIVVFDRIREVRGRNQKITWELINSAVNQTLSRTILTSFTTWLVSLILYAVGGAAIHGMAFCLVVGVVVGTYSSIYIASPMLIWFHSREAPARPPAAPRSDGAVARGPSPKPNGRRQSPRTSAPELPSAGRQGSSDASGP